MLQPAITGRPAAQPGSCYQATACNLQHVHARGHDEHKDTLVRSEALGALWCELRMAKYMVKRMAKYVVKRHLQPSSQLQAQPLKVSRRHAGCSGGEGHEGAARPQRPLRGSCGPSCAWT